MQYKRYHRGGSTRYTICPTDVIILLHDEAMHRRIGIQITRLIRSGIYYHISNAQYHNTALETTVLVMHDFNTFFYGLLHFLMALQIS